MQNRGETHSFGSGGVSDFVLVIYRSSDHLTEQYKEYQQETNHYKPHHIYCTDR